MEVGIREIHTSLNAFDIYSLFGHKTDTVLLDSSRDKDGLGKYSIIGLNPFKKVTYKNGVMTQDGAMKSVDPFKALNRTLQNYTIKKIVQTCLLLVGV